MLSVLKKISVSGLVLGLCAIGAIGCGTDPDEACEIICAKNEECQHTVKAECISVCKEQAKDEATADAFVEQSECYEDATCDQVSSGTCVPKEL